MAERGDSKLQKAVWKEFDCPDCAAHNPWDDGFTYGEELFCSWCGVRLVVRRVKDDLGEEQRYKLIVD